MVEILVDPAEEELVPVVALDETANSQWEVSCLRASVSESTLRIKELERSQVHLYTTKNQADMRVEQLEQELELMRQT